MMKRAIFVEARYSVRIPQDRGRRRYGYWYAPISNKALENRVWLAVNAAAVEANVIYEDSWT